jgi:hypothetical protein
MTKEIRLNAFDMNCVGHIQHGMWTHPRDRSTEYNTIGYWQDLARLAERGKFDGIFLADIVSSEESSANSVFDGNGFRNAVFRRQPIAGPSSSPTIRPSRRSCWGSGGGRWIRTSSTRAPVNRVIPLLWCPIAWGAHRSRR